MYSSARTIISTVFVLMTIPGHTQENTINLPKTSDQIRQLMEQQFADQSLKDPRKRRYLIAEQINIICDSELTQHSRPQVIHAIRRLGRLRATEAIPQLVKVIDFSISDELRRNRVDEIPSMEDRYPGITSLTMIGRPALAKLIEAATIQDGSGPYNGILIHTIRKIVGASNNTPTQVFLNHCADEYSQRPLRYRTLAKQLLTSPITSQSVPIVPPKPRTEILPGEDVTKAVIIRLARIFEMQDVLTDEKLTLADETKVVQALVELGQLHALEAAPWLADKMDWERRAPELNDSGQPIPPGIMEANPKGLLSPAITDAATKALLEIGAPALPSVLEAVAMSRRPPRYRTNALAVIVRLAGGPDAARTVLLAAADENEKKAQRLRKIADSLPKVS